LSPRKRKKKKKERVGFPFLGYRKRGKVQVRGDMKMGGDVRLNTGGKKGEIPTRGGRGKGDACFRSFFCTLV